MRAAVEPFRIPARERTDLVDHPALPTTCAGGRGWRWRVAGARREVSETGRFVMMLGEQQANVIQQEPAAFGHRDFAPRPAGGHVGSLRKNPRVAKDATADQHT